MADDSNVPIDPALLRTMRGIIGRPTITRGAGLVDNPFLFRQLQRFQQPIIPGGMSRSMPGFSPARPGAGSVINPSTKLPDPVVQGEMGPEELKTLASPNLNAPKPGGNISGFKSETIPYMNANDSENILKQRLDNMRRNTDDQAKYQMALTWQRNRQRENQPEQPIFQSPASITPLAKDIKPRTPHKTKNIYGAANILEQLGKDDDAVKVRQYNFMTEQFRDKIKDYHLAHSDLREWINKNAVPDIHAGMEDMDRINEFLKFQRQPQLTFPEYKELKQFELKEKIRRRGADSFYTELKSNLTSMHSELDRIHKLIEEHGE